MTRNKPARNKIIDEYLAELDHAARHLPANRRAELLTDVTSHIAVARAEAGATGEAEDEAAVRRILSQLGDPGEIAATALADLPNAPVQEPVSRRWEIIAVVLLLFGGFLAGVGWLVGVVMLWASPRWSWGDKLLGTLLVPGGLALTIPAAGFAAMAGPVCSTPVETPEPSGTFTQGMLTQGCASGSGIPIVAIAIIAFLVIAPIYTAIRLTRHAHRA